jgi:hypothetical protein
VPLGNSRYAGQYARDSCHPRRKAFLLIYIEIRRKPMRDVAFPDLSPLLISLFKWRA